MKRYVKSSEQEYNYRDNRSYTEDVDGDVVIEMWDEETGIYYDINASVSHDPDAEDEFEWSYFCEIIDTDLKGFETYTQGYARTQMEAIEQVDMFLDEWAVKE